MISKLNPWFALIFSVVSVCQALSGDCADNLVMTAPGGWLELEEPPLFTKDGRRFTMALSANGYKQVNVINRDTNQRVPITSGRMVVTNIYHWDEVNHEIYFKVYLCLVLTYLKLKTCFLFRPLRRILQEKDICTKWQISSQDNQDLSHVSVVMSSTLGVERVDTTVSSSLLANPFMPCLVTVLMCHRSPFIHHLIVVLYE